MSLTIIQNTTGIVNPNSAIVSTGWTISGEYAIHDSCVSGSIKSITNIGLVVGRQYTITYQVDQYVNNGVRVSLGTNNGTTRTANGVYTETLTCIGTSVMSFFSDGTLRIKRLMFYDTATGIQSGTTVSFNEGMNRWGCEYSYLPETMMKFINGFFSVKNGNLYEHNTNVIPGQFYGTKYPARITMVVNAEYDKEKLYFNLRLDAKGQWYAPVISTPNSNQFPNGMLSRLKQGNFKLIDNKLWSSFLGDMLDPNFATKSQAEALFNGRKLQGGWLILTLENNDTKEAQIASCEVYYLETERAM